ncbi:S1C family serine protease [Nodosilinea nodulosa]|uniref:S1C family serine protease n=1 Tax=Nodosilinea nodulosa TaxID=416001 RepID=UPI000318F070|nr:S1C family serine protease [Nodosilinea nodulosa]
MTDMTDSSRSNPGALAALSDGLADAVSAIAPALVAVKGHRRFTYSGLHWQPGVIVTADYGLGRSSQLALTLPDGNVVEVEVSGRDRALDLAVLRIERTDLPLPAISDGAALRVGQLVLAVGQSWEYGVSASLGLVGNLGGPWQTSQGRAIDRLIRPDLDLYPNLLGGPLVDTAGRVLGLNLSGPRNRVVTLPASTLDRIVATLLEHGSLKRGYLGVGLQPVALPKTLDLPGDTGLLVISLDASGPAEQAGLLIGDILLAVGGQPVQNLAAVYGHLEASSIGQAVQLHLLRGGQPVDLTVTLGEQPQGGSR